MLSKYRMEKANAAQAIIEAKERLAEVRAEIKEVEAKLEKAKRNAKFEDKYKDNPYWQIAKKRYIETGDPSSIENFRARQEALETSAKDRALKREVELEYKNKQAIYDEAEAIKEIRLREEDVAKAKRAGDEELKKQAEVYLDFAIENYKNLTGKDWNEVSKKKANKPSSETPTVENDVNEPSSKTPVGGNEGNDNEPWWKSNPLSGESGAKNAKEFGDYLMKFSDANDKNGLNRIVDEATKNAVISWIEANKDKFNEMGLDQTKVNSIKNHWSKEKYDEKSKAKKEEIIELKRAYNLALEKGDEDEKERLWNLLESKGVKMPNSIDIPFDIK